MCLLDVWGPLELVLNIGAIALTLPLNFLQPAALLERASEPVTPCQSQHGKKRERERGVGGWWWRGRGLHGAERSSDEPWLWLPGSVAFCFGPPPALRFDFQSTSAPDVRGRTRRAFVSASVWQFVASRCRDVDVYIYDEGSEVGRLTVATWTD